MPRKTVDLVEAARPVDTASMRPRPDAAENREIEEAGVVSLLVSMRTRPDAAENPGLDSPLRLWQQGFNEAAARCRGKPQASVPHRRGGRLASMRPRPDAAENQIRALLRARWVKTLQ